MTLQTKPFTCVIGFYFLELADTSLNMNTIQK